MKKLFLLITILLFVSGCEIDYKIIYNSSNDITEEVTVGVYNSIIYQNDENIEDYFNGIVNSYRESYNLKKYKMSLKERTGSSYMILKKNHKNIEDLLSNEVLNMAFLNRDVYNDGDNLVVKLSGYNYYYDDTTQVELSNLNVTLVTNYKVKTNASSANNMLGIYKWEFEPTDEEKTLEIEFTDQLNIIAYIYNIFPLFFWILLFIVIVVLFIFLCKIIKKRIEKSNEI